MKPSIALIPGLLNLTIAGSVPANVQSFYNRVKSQKACTTKLQGGFQDSTGSDPSWAYCESGNAVYIHKSDGGLANMDIDVDGIRDGHGNPHDSQDETSFKDIVKSYDAGIVDLHPYTHSYVVFGNTGDKTGYTNFNPQEYGIQPLSVMAVVCNNQMFYGVWGDENGDDDWYGAGNPDSEDVVGEASIALAQACFGDSMTPDSGHDEPDVLYVAFKGDGAVPGAKGAKWDASSFGEFEASIRDLGDSLVGQLS